MDETIMDQRLKARRNLAREYRRLGYAVTEQPLGEALPEFLRDFSPDLVAVKNGDRVVVEIKNVAALKGANEIKELASRVEAHSGWRFELIALDDRRNEAAAAISAVSLETMIGRSLDLCHRGLVDAALLYTASVVEELVQDAVVAAESTVRGRNAQMLIQELVFRGVIGEATGSALERTLEWRHRIAHGNAGEAGPESNEILAAVAACRELQAALQLQAA